MAEPDIQQVRVHRGRTAFADGSEAQGDRGPAVNAGVDSRRYRHPAGNALVIRCRRVNASEHHTDKHSRIHVRSCGPTRKSFARSAPRGAIRHRQGIGRAPPNTSRRVRNGDRSDQRARTELLPDHGGPSKPKSACQTDQLRPD